MSPHGEGWTASSLSLLAMTKHRLWLLDSHLVADGTLAARGSRTACIFILRCGKKVAHS
jgi:hypothetical protein